MFDAMRLKRWQLSHLFRRVVRGGDGVARVGRRQIYILPTGNGLRFAGVLFVMLLGSLNYQNNLGLLFTFFLASVALVAMHHTWFNLLGLSVQARGGPPVFVGDDATFEVVVGTNGTRARFDIGIPTGETRHQSIAILGGDCGTIRIARPALRRGLSTLDEVTVETRYPLHLFRAWCYVQTDATTLVYPKPAQVAPEPGSAAGDTEPRRRQGPEGMEDYLGPRPYRDSDSPRQIDWKAYARERGLVVKQFGGDQGQEVWIDWAALTAADPETRISVLARQVLDAGEAQVRFGLRLPGLEETPGRGAGHLQRCLTHLALYDHVQTNDPLQRAA
ncbi:DUF58 domain-containing protein [Thiocapsa bogorovii]|jgi:uncharacterized protein (DUF58 family)|uniref:DUF58 domain-containing protein n=1 Tax=Thiocapsa bogorovii TaxID=521689 RepID=UPI001E475952|nr:DUF58 domain-containing protein [Thiocapsa bogorovii]UHD18839.1 DUF58 domain-containing protein [Thiocapsa bogorovii]